MCPQGALTLPRAAGYLRARPEIAPRPKEAIKAMRARAGDPPRTMTQKILAGRSGSEPSPGELTRVKVDQVVLAREPNRALADAAAMGLKKCSVELAIAYDTHCVTQEGADQSGSAADSVAREALQSGLLLARPGIGFAPAVHLERFASPARLAVTDEPRLASVGGAGMLTLCVAPGQLADALVTGSVTLRAPRAVQVLLSGRVRPFVCVRDVALELVRRGLGALVERVDREHGAPVVLEFTGPSARLLSVPERAVLAGLAPQLGAAGALFVSDEKTEVYLRDQRRSKAHRGLAADPGAPSDDVITVDLSAVDPLLQDEEGVVRPVRELAGKPVHQAVLGGDTGVSLRDLLAAAALLKSKRVPPRLDFLLAAPSRQTLEVLAQAGALVDLIATGARPIEPDRRLVTGELYPPVPGGTSLRTYDPEPTAARDSRFVVGSAETLAYAVATGQIGDPRTFKRPVRITVPRALPTDDVLVVRKGKGRGKDAEGSGSPQVEALRGWAGTEDLAVQHKLGAPLVPTALVLASLDEVRWATRNAARWAAQLRVVIAPHVPAGTVATLAGHGIIALAADEAALRALRAADRLEIAAPSETNSRVSVRAGGAALELDWRAEGLERDWAVAGSARPPKAAPR